MPGRTGLAGGKAEGRAFQERPRAGRAWWGALLVLAGFTGLGMLASAAGAAVIPADGPAALAPAAPAWPAVTIQAGMDVLPGAAAWLVWRRPDVGLHRKKAALRLWGWALPVRALLAAAAAMPHTAAAWNPESAAALLLCGLTLLCFRAFWPLRRVAAAMLLPYMACIAATAWLGAGV